MIVVAAIACFVITGVCAIFRVIAGPGLADRVVALEVALVSLMGVVAIDAASRNDTSFLVLTVVLAIVGFTATVAASRFIDDSVESTLPERDPS